MASAKSFRYWSSEDILSKGQNHGGGDKRLELICIDPGSPFSGLFRVKAYRSIKKYYIRTNPIQQLKWVIFISLNSPDNEKCESYIATATPTLVFLHLQTNKFANEKNAISKKVFANYSFHLEERVEWMDRCCFI